MGSDAGNDVDLQVGLLSFQVSTISFASLSAVLIE